jgi:hypothetical protein
MNFPSDRNVAILEARLMAGKTYAEIAKENNISPERVREILMKFRRMAINYTAMMSRSAKEIELLKKQVAELSVKIATDNNNLKSWGMTDISSLDIGVRAMGRLSDAGIFYAGQIDAMTDEVLLSIPGMGRKSVYEIRTAIRNLKGV